MPSAISQLNINNHTLNTRTVGHRLKAKLEENPL